jgi:ureidoglycolate hydrolase
MTTLRKSTIIGLNMKIRKLTHSAIRPYGYIIDSKCVKDDGKTNCFGILLKEKAKGWRIGYLIVRDKKIKRLEMHPDSFETFEPVKGKLVIAFAPNKNPAKIKVFRLDKPVVVKKGVWHEVAAISPRAEVKLFENIEVKTKYIRI